MLENQILNDAETKIETSLVPANKQDYLKVVNAGLATGLKGGPKSILASLKNSKDPISDCVNGAINLTVLLRHQSRNTMPLKALVPAAMTLMLHALDFADKIGLVKVGTPELVKATHLFGNAMMKKAGITPQMLHTAASKVHGITQDPAQVAKLQQASGGGVA